MLPDTRSILIGRNIAIGRKCRNWKIQMWHFGWFSNNVNEVSILLHCIFIIWSVALKLIKRANEAWNQIHTTLLLWFTTWPCIPKKFQRFSVFLSEKSAPNPRDHDLDSDDDPSSNNHVLAIWHRQLLFTNPNLDRFEAEAQLKMNGIQFRQNCRCVWTKKVGA